MPFGDLETRLLAVFTAAFESCAAEAADAYAAAVFLHNVDEDARRPVAVACLATEDGVEAALRRRPGILHKRPVPESAEEARWDVAYWSHPDLARFADPDEDPDGAAAVERWIRLEGLWYTDEDEVRDVDTGGDTTTELGVQIDERLLAILVTVARELQSDVLPRVLGRSIPVLIQDPDFDDSSAGATRDANPPGVAGEYLDWLARRPADPLPWGEAAPPPG